MQTSAEATGFQANIDSLEARVSANNELEVLGAAGRDIYVCSGGILIEVPIGADDEFTGTILFSQKNDEPKVVGFFRLDEHRDFVTIFMFDNQYFSDAKYTRVAIRGAIISVVGNIREVDFKWHTPQ